MSTHFSILKLGVLTKIFNMGKWVNCHIYKLDYLKKEELNEDDLHYIFDTGSLNASLILHEFRVIGDKRQDWEIMKMARTTHTWPDEYSMTRKQYDEFKKNIIDVFKNVYQYRDIAARQKAEWWLLCYGLKIKN